MANKFKNKELLTSIKCEILGVRGTWRDVADSARTTINKPPGMGEPSSSWKKRMLMAEHSPIRQIQIHAKWTDLPSWVSVHLARHKIGIEHWVRSQRSDRSGVDRDNISQSAVVEHEILASAQSIINISRKRLCYMAAGETRYAWTCLLSKLNRSEPELFDVCVPDCIYRGNCYEYKTCGQFTSRCFREKLKEYRNIEIV